MSKKPSQPPEKNDKPVVEGNETSYDPLAPIPVPQTQEINSDSVWALFEDVHPAPDGEPQGYAATTIAPLPDMLADRQPPSVETTRPAGPGAAGFEETSISGADLPPPRDFDSTSALSLDEMSAQARIEHELAIIGKHHERIAKAIRVFWGHKGCVEYIEELILNGNDGADYNRAGFKLEVLSALINLASLHTIQ